jgi:hypothetical protein
MGEELGHVAQLVGLQPGQESVRHYLRFGMLGRSRRAYTEAVAVTSQKRPESGGNAYWSTERRPGGQRQRNLLLAEGSSFKPNVNPNALLKRGPDIFDQELARSSITQSGTNCMSDGPSQSRLLIAPRYHPRSSRPHNQSDCAHGTQGCETL